MKLSHEHTRGTDYDVMWVDRSENGEELEPRFIANQEGSLALLTLKGLKRWAERVLADNASFPADAPLDMSGEFQSLIMNKPKAPGWVEVTPTVVPGRNQLLLRYQVNGDWSCKTYFLEG